MKEFLLRPAALLAAGVMSAAGLIGCRPTPEFYEPPAEVPATPGEIIHNKGVLFDKKIDVRANALMYSSTDTHGQPVAVTGTLLYPSTPWQGEGPRPIIGFAPGTRGLGDKCAPSYMLPGGDDYEKSTLTALIDKGWAVAITDYEGLGPPGDHTYVIRKTEAQALLDVVRAAQTQSQSGVTPASPVGLWGYSQGGQAAASAAEIEADYAPELDIRGVVAGGVPADLMATAENLNGTGPGNDFFAFLLFAAVGLNAAYPELNLESYLNELGQDLFDNNRQMCMAEALELGKGHHIDELVTSNPMETPEWQARIEEQRTGTAAPAIPAFLHHGANDQVMLDQTIGLRDAWCGGGATVQFQEYDTDHVGGVFAGTADGVAYMTGRFAGEAPPNTCA